MRFNLCRFARPLKITLSVSLLSVLFACKKDSKPAEPSAEPEVITSTVLPTPTPTVEPLVEFPIVPYTIEERPIQLENKYIYGKAYIPDDGMETHPTVILCHGIGNTLSNTENFSMMFAERGIAAYAFDFCGGGEQSESSGSFLEMSVKTEAEDLNDVINFVQQQDFVNTLYLFLLGQSQGGYVVTEVAHKRQEELAGIILMYPAFNINDLVSEMYPDPSQIPETGEIFNLTVGRKYFEDALAEDIKEDINLLEKDTLIIHGSSDELVPIKYSREAVDLFWHAKLVTIWGAPHGFFGLDGKKALSACLEFILAHSYV